MSSTPFLAEARVVDSDDAAFARALNEEEINRSKPITCVEAQAYEANEHYYQDPYQTYSSSSRNSYGPYERRAIYQNEIDEELNGMLLFCWYVPTPNLYF